jgi:predicted secreted Zn-dependent protease
LRHIPGVIYLAIKHSRRAVLPALGGLILLLTGGPNLRGAEVSHAVQWVTNYYAVTGATTREIRSSISQSRPWKNRFTWDGFTDWKVTWRFRTSGEADGNCRVSDFRPSAVVTTTLPRWTPPPDVSTEVKQAWQRYFVALLQHETVHGRYAYAAVEEMQRKIPALPAMSCDELQKKINDLANQIMDDYRRREKEYDQRTQHGALQGARMP